MSREVVNMPANPLHYPLAYLFYRLSPRWLDLPALVVGAVIPDLEILFFELAGRPGGINRLALHSLFGATVLCPVLVVSLRWAVYAPLTRSILRAEIGHRDVGVQLLSGAGGAVSHVLLDLPGHPYNPLLWPLTAESVNLFHSLAVIRRAQAAIDVVMTLVGVTLLIVLAIGARSWRTYLCRLFCNERTPASEGAISQRRD